MIEDIIQIAKKAGDEILAVYTRDFSYRLKSDQSPLTEADQNANRLIVAELKKLTPDVPIIAEESAVADWSVRKNWQQYWLVDPLDGTKEFIKKNGEFTVNIALVDGHKPTLGVVFAPALGQMWMGEKNHPAQKITNGKRRTITAQKYRADDILKVAGSRTHGQENLRAYLARVGRHELISAGSSMKMCLVAEGSAHLYPRLSPTSEWDTAAAHIVADCAGASVVDYRTQKPLKYNCKASLENPFFIVHSPGCAENADIFSDD